MKLLVIFLISTAQCLDVKIWGPGLKPHVYRTPVRYFFIQLQNVDLNKTTIKLEVNVFGISLVTNKQCRVWTQLLNRNDGLYIARYKLYETCNMLEVHVKHDNEHLLESPYITKNVIYAEDCDCPEDDTETWLSNWKCPNNSNQIQQDLSNFKDINWSLLRNKLIKEYDNPGGISLCHYIIKKSRIFRRCYGKHVGFKMFVDNILLSISRKVSLPDLEFFANLGDWPLMAMNPKYPIFSWCASTDTYDIVMPTYDISESTLEMMGGVTLDMLSVQGNTNLPWPERIPKVFWRGRDSNPGRLKLVNISRENPDLFNVSLTNFFFYRDEIDIYGPKSDHVSFFEFFNYKYQVSIDGTVAAYRFPYLLAGGSLVFKQTSKYYEHFYMQLEPYKHYIPIKKDLSDLVDKIKWAKENDEEAQQIAKKGQLFAFENLLPTNIYCYYVILLQEFSKKIISDINILPDMDEVVHQKKNHNCKCSHKNNDNRDEL